MLDGGGPFKWRGPSARRIDSCLKVQISVNTRDILRVLVVDDDVGVADLVQDVVEFNGPRMTGIAFEVRSATSLSGVQVLLASDGDFVPDICLVDVNFHLTNGDSDEGVERILPYLRTLTEFDARFANTRIIVYTGQLGDRDFDEIETTAKLGGAIRVWRKEELEHDELPARLLELSGGKGA